MTRSDSRDKAELDADFEAMLDKALRARSQAGPRAGFHHRLSESLRRSGDDRSAHGPWWSPFSLLLGTITLAAAVVGTLVVLHHRPAHPPEDPPAFVRNSPAAPATGAHASITTVRQPEHRLPASPRVKEAVSARVEKVQLELQNGDAATEALPKLDTFPSVTRDAGRPFGSGDPPQVISAEAANAMLSLQQQQARPIVLTSLNLNAPLFGEK